jgi:hypothetical protein
MVAAWLFWLEELLKLSHPFLDLEQTFSNAHILDANRARVKSFKHS